MWFDIVGIVFGFIGSVIFSAGLLKPKEQILDENKTYWNANPYTTKAELSSQKYYVIAFILIIIGFATTLGGALGRALFSSDVAVSIVIAIGITFGGCLCVSLLYISRIFSHQTNKLKHRKTVFISSLKSNKKSMKSHIGKSNEVALYESAKPVYQAAILEKAKEIAETDNESEIEIANDLKSANSAQEFISIIDKYLNV